MEERRTPREVQINEEKRYGRGSSGLFFVLLALLGFVVLLAIALAALLMTGIGDDRDPGPVNDGSNPVIRVGSYPSFA